MTKLTLTELRYELIYDLPVKDFELSGDTGNAAVLYNHTMPFIFNLAYSLTLEL